jgi:hypothetical protein
MSLRGPLAVWTELWGTYAVAPEWSKELGKRRG